MLPDNSEGLEALTTLNMGEETKYKLAFGGPGEDDYSITRLLTISSLSLKRQQRSMKRFCGRKDAYGQTMSTDALKGVQGSLPSVSKVVTSPKSKSLLTASTEMMTEGANESHI